LDCQVFNWRCLCRSSATQTACHSLRQNTTTGDDYACDNGGLDSNGGLVVGGGAPAASSTREQEDLVAVAMATALVLALINRLCLC